MGGGNPISNLVNTVTSPLATIVAPQWSVPAQLATGQGPVGDMVGINPPQPPPQFDAGGRPIMAPFESQLAGSGLLKEPYNLTDKYNAGALTQLRTDALRQPGTLSKWGQMQKANVGNQVARDQAGQLATASSNLAMQGGLRAGARERLQQKSQQSGLLAKQQGLNQVSMQDEQNRQSQLNSLLNQEMGQANYQTGLQNTNVGNALKEVGQGRLYEMNKYNEAMRAWAAANTANAMPQTQDRGLIGNLLGSLF